MDFFFETSLYDPNEIQTKMEWSHFKWFLRWVCTNTKLSELEPKILKPMIKSLDPREKIHVDFVKTASEFNFRVQKFDVKSYDDEETKTEKKNQQKAFSTFAGKEINKWMEKGWPALYRQSAADKVFM
jgi:hypothetical protein